MWGAASMRMSIPFCFLSTAIEAASGPPAANCAVASSHAIVCGHGEEPFRISDRRSSEMPMCRACSPRRPIGSDPVGYPCKSTLDCLSDDSTRGAELPDEREAVRAVDVGMPAIFPASRPMTPAFAE